MYFIKAHISKTEYDNVLPSKYYHTPLVYEYGATVE
jgi:hypothetical protein